jgi:uncharacterized membrane protein YjjB (DUF3815 family)
VLPPATAAERLRAIDREAPPFAAPWRVLGVALFSAGFSVSVQATWQEAIVTGLLGLLILAAERWPRLEPLAPLLASLLVGVVVLTLHRDGWVHGGPVPLMIPALFMFIPGDALSAAMVELTEGRLTAGAARLIYSLALIGVLAFGAFLAAELLELPPSAIFDTPVGRGWGPIADWAGWAVFSVGVMLAFSMRPRDLPWAMGMVFGTYAVLLVGTAAFDEIAGTFLAAAAMTVAAELLGRSPRMPPRFVLWLGAFFVLTSGGLGLRGIETWIGGDAVTGAADLGDMLGLLTALGLGVLLGTAAVPPAPPSPTGRRPRSPAADRPACGHAARNVNWPRKRARLARIGWRPVRFRQHRLRSRLRSAPSALKGAATSTPGSAAWSG